MDWIELIKSAVLFVGGSFSILFFALGIKLLFSDRSEYQQNRNRYENIFAALTGTVKTVFDGSRDYRVRAGLAVNKKNQWVEQGALSEEALDAVLRK